MRKLGFFIFVSHSLLSRPNAVVVCRPLSSFPLVVCCLISRACRHHPSPLLSAAVVIRHWCHCPLSPLLSAAAIIRRCSHHCHSTVSTFSCRPLLSFPIVVQRPILHAVIVRRYCCPPLPSSSAATIFHRHRHHHNSAVSAVSHCLLSSFPIAAHRQILRIIVVRLRHHPPQLLSAVPVPPLVLPPTLRC